MDLDRLSALGNVCERPREGREDDGWREGVESFAGVRDQILVGGELHYDQIMSANGLMVAWKFLVKKRLNFRQKSLRFLKGLQAKTAAGGGTRPAHASHAAEEGVDSSRPTATVPPPTFDEHDSLVELD